MNKEPISEEKCEHEWVDATNKVVRNGYLCTKCNSISNGKPIITPQTNLSTEGDWEKLLIRILNEAYERNDLGEKWAVAEILAFISLTIKEEVGGGATRSELVRIKAFYEDKIRDATSKAR